MALDEMIEQLAFGRSMPKMNSCIGLAISSEMMFVSEARIKDGKPAVDHLLRIPIPSAGKDTLTRVAGSLNTELLTDTEKIAGLLKPAMSQTKWGSTNVVVSISHHFGLLRYFTMPSVDRKFWKTAIPSEAKKYIPIPFGDLVYDFQVIPVPPGPDKRPRFGVLFGVIHRKNLDSVRAIAEKLDLKLLGVELAPCSVERLWDSLGGQAESQPYGQVHFDGGWLRILLSENGVPIFFRELLLPDDGVSLDLRKVDLSGCIDFCRKQLGAKPPVRINVSGVNGSLAAWKESFGQEIGLPVEFRDISKALGLKAGEWGGYASLGGAIRFLHNTPIKIELSQSNKVSEEERQAAKAIFALAAVLSAFMLVAGFARSTAASIKSVELAKLKRQSAMIPAFQGKSADQIQKLIQEMEDKANSFSNFLGGQHDFTKILEVVADDAPDKLWISGIHYSSTIGEIGTAARTPRLLKLKGGVMAESLASEQETAMEFKAKLQADVRFNKVFNCIAPSIVTNTTGATSSTEQTQSPQSLNQTQETRTSFDIDCSAKRR
ncbi:MAG: hypothetical protein HY078_00145 [Elusimicrobia bacterium]|nr:hypothetical protein [Elusimicrobiota bacterium]